MWNPDNLEDLFEKITANPKGPVGQNFIVANEYDDTFAQILKTKNGEWRIFVNTPPGEPKFFSPKEPFGSLEEFMDYAKTIGLPLVLKKAKVGRA